MPWSNAVGSGGRPTADDKHRADQQGRGEIAGEQRRNSQHRLRRGGRRGQHVGRDMQCRSGQQHAITAEGRRQ
ncbi:MAG: hypothetical protein WCQ77_06070, partial [Planctomycetota bacterium]